MNVDPQRPLGSGDTQSVRLASLAVYGSALEFASAIRSELQRNKQHAVLLYIHGYKNAFRAAAESAAQIAADTKFSGAAVIFSWPSDGALMRYPSDAEEIQGSKGNFVELLRILSDIESLQRINVLTHSMGGRLIADSLEWLSSQPASKRPRIYHLVLAAPDIRVSLFKQATPGMQGLSKKVTLYSSRWDQALQCSMYFNNAPRAGQAGEHIVVLREIDTVDASAVEKPSGLFAGLPCTPSGHSYISQNPAVLSDLYELLAYDALPARRQRLRPENKDGLPYWTLR